MSSMMQINKDIKIGVLSSVVSGLEESISALGVDPQPIFTHFPDLYCPAEGIQKITLNDFCHAIDIAADMTGNEHFALYYGAHCKMDALGLLGYLFQNSDTLYDGLQALVAYFPCHQQMSEMRLVPIGDYYRLDYQVDSNYLSNRRADAEISLAMFCNLIRKFLGPQWKPVRIGFEHSQPSNTLPHYEFFNCEIEFDYLQNSIYIKAEELNFKIPSADPFLFQLIKRNLVQEGFPLSEQEKFLKEVEATISKKITEGIPHIEEVAADLNLPVWTFKRRLAQINKKFSELVESKQKKVALDYLENRQETISEIAYRLGYADTSSFSKAFQRWYGISPKSWRAQRNL